MALTTNEQLQDVLFNWTALATGLAEEKIVWLNQPSVDDDGNNNPTAAGAPQAKRPYLTLQILRTTTLGRSGGDVRHVAPTAPAPADAPSEVVKLREGTLVINAYSVVAQNFIEAIRAFRDKPTAPPVQSPVAATAEIAVVADVNDGETFTLDDGAGQVVVFEFDDDVSFVAGNIPVDISGGPDANGVRDAILAALATVSGWPTLLVVGTDGGAATVTLTHLRPGRKGNDASSTETVVDAGFSISDFSGGEDSDVAFGRELGSQDQTAAQGGLFSARARIDLEFRYRLREDDPDVGAIEQVQFIGLLDDTSRVIDVDLTQA